jgi:dTDP-4-dehydrorhamnose 3,5-epimerase
MEVRATSISGVVTFKPRPHRDNRGVFTRTFDAAIGARHGVVFGEYA